MAACILVILILAIMAPLLQRGLGKATHWLLGGLTAAVAAWLAAKFPALLKTERLIEAYNWVPALDLSFALHADALGLMLAVVVTGMGTLILVYAGGYLHGARNAGSFYAYLLLFMASMLGVALADNLILIFIFWELTSFSSYLLIGFNHERAQSRAAALQALLVTGGGGLALLAGFILLGIAGDSLTLSTLLERGPEVRSHPLYALILPLVLLAAATKSAQFPFHYWLPNAMEAPTPVSAYLHSATMVKAGVFLLARVAPILGGTTSWQVSLVALGMVTMILGAWLSFTARELKRILAYSTISGLGTMTLLLGVGTPAAIQAAILYLLAHALYKGALFMLAGSITHATDRTDAEEVSGLARAMPISAVGGVLAALSMAGLPTLLGFVSKEATYESLLNAGHLEAVLVTAAVAAHVLLLVVAVRVGIRPFVRIGNRASPGAHEVPASMWLGPLVAGLVALVGPFGLHHLDRLVVGPVEQVVLGGAPEHRVKLALWHGVNVPLGLSAVTLAAGLAILALRERISAGARRVRWPAWLSAGAAHDTAVSAMNGFARTQTRVLQSGYLRQYVFYILLMTAALAIPRLIMAEDLFSGMRLSPVRVHELAAAALVLGGAMAAVFSTSRLGAVASLSVVGFGMTLIFVLFSAPDLAMTQILIETLLVILFVLVLYRLPAFATYTRQWVRAADAGVAAVFGAMMTCLALLAMEAPRGSRVSQYYADHSLTDAHGRNVVNVILVDFRAADTLGEITVLAVAAIGVYGLMRLRPRRNSAPRAGECARANIAGTDHTGGKL